MSCLRGCDILLASLRLEDWICQPPWCQGLAPSSYTRCKMIQEDVIYVFDGLGQYPMMFCGRFGLRFRWDDNREEAWNGPQKWEFWNKIPEGPAGRIFLGAVVISIFSLQAQWTQIFPVISPESGSEAYFTPGHPLTAYWISHWFSRYSISHFSEGQINRL